MYKTKIEMDIDLGDFTGRYAIGFRQGIAAVSAVLTCENKKESFSHEFGNHSYNSVDLDTVELTELTCHLYLQDQDGEETDLGEYRPDSFEDALIERKLIDHAKAQDVNKWEYYE